MAVDLEPLYATILILVVTKQQILLAADSRKTYLDANGVRKTGTMQKLREVNGYYYAIAGIYEDETTGFSIAKLLEDVFLETTDIKKAIQHITHQLATALKTYFSQLQQFHPSLLQQLKQQSASGGELFIVKKLANLPTAYNIEYRFSEKNDLQVIVKNGFIDCTQLTNSNTCFYRLVGNVIPSSLSRFTEKQWATEPVESIHWVMQESQKAFPDFVSAPFSIVSLSANGVEWL